MDVGHNHGEVREKQEIHGPGHDAETHERLVEDAVASEKGNPGDHPDDVGGPERYRAQEEKTDLPKQSANMEHQEIGDVEADEQRYRPDDQRKLERAQIEPQRHARREDLEVVVEDEGWIQPPLAIVEEADGDDHQHRQAEEEHENKGDWRDLNPGREPRRGFHHPPRRATPEKTSPGQAVRPAEYGYRQITLR